MGDTEHFDLEAPADVFIDPGRRHRLQPVVYRRFDSSVEAIRHVIEGVEAVSLLGAVIETDETHAEAADIGAIYESTDLPMARHVTKVRTSA